LEAPEIAEGSATPTIKTALYGKNAVEFGGCERNGNAPEEGNKGEKQNRHPWAGVVEDAFVAERAAGGVAVEEREKRKKADLTEVRVFGRKGTRDFSWSFLHRLW
jgi:hypothetical protein